MQALYNYVRIYHILYKRFYISYNIKLKVRKQCEPLLFAICLFHFYFLFFISKRSALTSALVSLPSLFMS